MIVCNIVPVLTILLRLREKQFIQDSPTKNILNEKMENTHVLIGHGGGVVNSLTSDMQMGSLW